MSSLIFVPGVRGLIPACATLIAVWTFVVIQLCVSVRAVYDALPVIVLGCKKCYLTMRIDTGVKVDFMCRMRSYDTPALL